MKFVTIFQARSGWDQPRVNNLNIPTKPRFLTWGSL